MLAEANPYGELQREVSRLREALAQAEQRAELAEQNVFYFENRPDAPEKEIESLQQQVARLRRILQAILDADERGQGLPFKEAMDAAQAALAPEAGKAVDPRLGEE